LVRLTAALAAAVTLGAAPGVALAAGGSSPVIPDTTSPFSPGVPISPATTPPTTTATPTVAQPTTTSASSSSGLSGTSAIEIAIVAVLVLGGIAGFIWHDARHRAPVRRAAADLAGGPGSASRGSKVPPKPRKLSPAERRRRKRGRAKR
jgi:hypothetical protein